jgi:lipid-binding SYLF domain-containing protein
MKGAIAHSHHAAFSANFRVSVIRYRVGRARSETRIEVRVMGSKRFIIAGGVVLALSCYAVSLSQVRTSTAKQLDEAARAENAATVLSEIMEAPNQGIPKALLKKAYAIAVIPHVVQGAFGIARYSKGVVAQKNADGDWGTPLFIEVGSGSVGLQSGVEPADVVVVFENSDGIKPLR